MSITRKEINAFRDSIGVGDRLVITERGWWRGDGADPDQYQRVTAVRAGSVVTESYRHPDSNQGFAFSAPKLVGDVVELTEDSIVYEAGPRRYRWGFRIER